MLPPFRMELKSWFLKEGRELSFRHNRTPYRVWVSEMMLQQTQAAVVVPYFERWMKLFPTVESLAHATIDQVLKAWEGLGYYSIARHLHSGAQLIVKWGVFPDNLEALPGVGPYTAAAIRSFALHQKAAAVDGNVLRVMARFVGEEGEIDRPAVRRRLVQAVEALLPDDEPWVTMEALIELGALICQRKPSCARCPLMPNCLAYRHGLDLPRRRPRAQSISIERTVALIEWEGHLLLKQGIQGRVMADLYEFPYLEGRCAWEDFSLGFPLEFVKELPIQRHSFTKYRATLYPLLLRAKGYTFNSSAGLGVSDRWVRREMVALLPLSSGHKRIYENFTQ